jgi:hypothetical protein
LPVGLSIELTIGEDGYATKPARWGFASGFIYYFWSGFHISIAERREHY